MLGSTAQKRADGCKYAAMKASYHLGFSDLVYFYYIESYTNNGGNRHHHS